MNGEERGRRKGIGLTVEMLRFLFEERVLNRGQPKEA